MCIASISTQIYIMKVLSSLPDTVLAARLLVSY